MPPSERHQRELCDFLWKEGEYYLGFLNDYPDYETQGMSKEELVSNLKDLLVDLESGGVPYVRKVEDLVVTE